MSQTDARVAVEYGSGAPTSLRLLGDAIDEVRSRQRLIRYLVAAEMKKRGSDTLLGNLWWILDPLLQMIVFVVFVSVISRRPAPDYPLFIFAAILPWKWYTSVVTDATGAVVKQGGLIRQIAFPKLVLPMATSTAGVVGFAWGLAALGLIMLLHPQRITLNLVWIPVIAFVQYVFTLATAILVSAANVFFRDLGNALGHLLRLWWFISPGLYSIAWLQELSVVQHHPILGVLASMNPFAVLFEAYRAAIYGTSDGGPPHIPDVWALLGLLLASLVLLALATIFFKRLEPNFAKVL